MSDIATCVIAGRLTRDAETHSAKLASVSIAHSHWNGTEEVTSYTDVKLLGDRWQKGGFQYYTKGKAVTVTGTLVQETWEKGGEKRSKHVVIADKICLQGGGDEGGSPRSGGNSGGNSSPAPAANSADGMDW